MYNFSVTSRSKLDSCHRDLITLAEEVIKTRDITIIFGHRTPEEQAKLYAIGRTEQKDRRPVTNCDGTDVLSKHNHYPSLAFDIGLYDPTERGIDWQDVHSFAALGGYVMRVAEELLSAGKMIHKVKWGADWDGDFQLDEHRLKDFPHFELIGVGA